MPEQKELDRLVQAVTEQVLELLQQNRQPRKRILVLGRDPACPIAACLSRSFAAETGADLDKAGEYDFVVLPTGYLQRLRGGDAADAATGQGGGLLDLTGRRLLHERELRERCTADIATVRVARGAIVTALAMDYLKRRGLRLERV